MYKDIIIHFCRFGKRILKRKVDVAMKDQHTKQTRSVVLSITAILLMLVISVMGLTAIVSADEEQWPTDKISAEYFLADTTKGMFMKDGSFAKEYDGTSAAYLTVNPAKNTIDGQAIVLIDATFVDVNGLETANVADATHIKVNYELDGTGLAAEALTLDAAIVASDDLVYEVTYNPNGIQSNNAAVTLKGVNGETVSATLLGDLGVLNVGTYENADVTANVTGTANYDASAITVVVTPLVIVDVDTDDLTWEYGTKPSLVVEGADGKPYYADQVFVDAQKAEAWAKGLVGTYNLTLNPNCEWETPTAAISVTIKPMKITVAPDASVLLGDGKNTYFPVLNPTLTNNDYLAEALSQLIYTVNGAAFNGASYGDYSVTVSLPENSNFELVSKNGTTYGKNNPLVVELKVRYESKKFDVVDSKTNEVVGSIILKASDENGFTDAVTVKAEALKGFPKIVKTKYNLVYKITITGAEEGQTFSVIVPLSDTVMAPRTEGIENGLFFYEDATGKLVAAKGAIAGDGYVEFVGIAGSATCVVAPDYNAPFFQTVWGILLIVVLILALLALMCYIGLRLRRVLETKEAPAMVIDTVGELPETEPVEVEEKAEVDENAVLEETAEEIAESVEETAEEAVEAVDAEALDAAVEEAIEEVIAEAAEEVVEVAAEEVAEVAAEEVVEAAAEEVVEAAAEEVVEAAAEEVVEAAAEEVVEAAAEEVVEAAAEEVVEAAAEEVAEVAAEEADEDDSDDTDDNDDNDDADGDNAEAVEAVSMVEDTGFGFGASADLATFIDVKENPEAYQEMLAREARGEIKIVYRYKKSFQSKLAQSLGNVQDYYSELKNALLTFKGVKNRLSWNYEAFNKGRVHIAKMDAKSKTLYLYLALDPSQFADTKYSVVDVSAKRKYASTPTLIKIKGERKFKHALELIEKVCGEQMTLEKVEAEKVDYKVARMTIDEMVEAGLMKQSAGYIVLPTEEV